MVRTEQDEVLDNASLQDFFSLDDEPIYKLLDSLESGTDFNKKEARKRLTELGTGLETVLQGRIPSERSVDLFFSSTTMYLLEKHSKKYFNQATEPLLELALLLMSGRNITLLRTLFASVHDESANLYELYLGRIAMDSQPYAEEWMRQHTLEIVTRDRPLSLDETLNMRLDVLDEASRAQLLLFPKDSHDNYLIY